MATYYIRDGGSNAADGLSFANAWADITNGATTARIAPGDTIRYVASPAATSLGINGTWTSQAQQATQAITSSTNATPIVITRASHGLSTGDTVVITGHTTNTNANGTWTVTNLTSSTFSLDGSVGNGVGGASGTFRRVNGMIVTLASAVTANIASTGNIRTAWTASANVTTSILTTDYKEGYGSDSIAIAAGFTTGLAAYRALGAATDFSGYQQVSFWIKQTVGTLATSGQITLRLCSDAVGAVSVNTITVPAIGALNTWQMVTVDLATNLGASIQSIALYVATDVAAQTFLLSNIIACKASSSADSINLKSLIGKNDGQWFPIMSINGTRVMLGAPNSILPTSALLGGYHGTSEAITTWKREPIDRGPFAAGTTADSTINDSGTAGNLITFSGGWNRTDMSTQTDETWLLSSNGNGVGLTANRNFVSVEKIHFAGWTTGVSISGTATDNTYNTIKLAACTTGFSFGTSLALRNTFSNLSAYMCGLSLTSAMCHSTYSTVKIIGGGNSTNGSALLTHRNCVVDGLEVRHVGDNAVLLGSTSTALQNSVCKNITVTAPASSSTVLAGTYRVYFETVTLTGGTSASATAINCTGWFFDTRFRSLTTSGHVTGIALTGVAGELTLIDASISETTEFSHNTTNADMIVYSQNHDSGGQSLIRSDAFTGGSTSSVTDGGSGKAWLLSPTGTSRDSFYPCKTPLGKYVVGASALVTVTARMQRSNTGMTLSLCCKGGQIAGVASDVRASASGAAGSFETVTITFTPSEEGVIELIAEAYGGTTFTGYVDNLTVSQA